MTPALARSAAEVPLLHRFADAFPQLALPWDAAEVAAPATRWLNRSVARGLGLDPEWLGSESGARFLVGNELPAGARPVAQAYAGHQFGYYSPRLGDGRALLLGELATGAGLVDLHLKGSGPTPFARDGDGLAALGPMLREFVVSLAMDALGIPTTRALAVVTTGTPVRRGGALPGAVLVRAARSHLRVGTFQYAAAAGDVELLRRLVDHAIERHHPAAASAATPALGLLDAVVEVQARLIAKWMLVGFVHGVMNTDNTTISGETIDYGPCAFIDGYDAEAVFSSIDHQGRYSYRNQPGIAIWNLQRFAEALLPLIDDDPNRAIELANASIGRFQLHYAADWLGGMMRKLGLDAPFGDDLQAELEFTDELLHALAAERTDWTGFFRALGRGAGDDVDATRSLFHDSRTFDAWAAKWLALGPDRTAMQRVNPVYIPRNHLVEEALAAAERGDGAPFAQLLEAVAAPYDERPGLERFAEPAPDDFGRYVTFCGT